MLATSEARAIDKHSDKIPLLAQGGCRRIAVTRPGLMGAIQRLPHLVWRAMMQPQRWLFPCQKTSCAKGGYGAACETERNPMKRLLSALFVCGVAGTLLAGDLHWSTSVPEAKAKAQKESKLVLLDFTGSDWCGWCKKLDAETFSKSEFADYAKKNLVLVEVDFPRSKTQSDDLKMANQELAKKYEVSGYPTLVVLKPDGTVVWKQVGYLAGGPEAMIAKLDEAKAK
jgi:thioredoxin-related protein